MTKARNIATLSTVEVGATTDQTKADLNAIGVSGGRKNLIINGGFDVWQRGTSYSYPNNLTYQCADRWRFQRTASSKVTTPYGNGVRITDNGQGYDMFEQVVEGHPSLFLAGQSYTFSFYVRASTPLSGLTAKMWGNTTNTGVIDENYTATSGWVKHTFTGTVASTLNEGMRVSPAPASINLTSGQWVEFAQVQLELGSVATDFEHATSYGETLALCQRYYQHINIHVEGHASAAGQYSHSSYVYPVKMRAVPTTVGVSGATSNIPNGGGFYDKKADGFRYEISSAGSGRYYHLVGFTTHDAEL